MLRRVLPPIIFCGLVLAAFPALAQNDLYDNGPTDGQTSAWTINFGFAISDSFTLNGNSEVNGLNFAAWIFPGDVLSSVEVAITSSEFGGTTYFDQIVNLASTGCFLNQIGFNVCNETGNFGTNVNLRAGTYWLTLDNACCSLGDPYYWDQNSGPSLASSSSYGTIPSESFTLLGSGSPTGTTPEPSNLILFLSGVTAVFGWIRRR